MTLFDKESSAFLIKFIEESIIFIDKNKYYIILILIIYVLLSIIHVKNEELKIRREAEGKGKVIKRNGTDWCYQPYERPKPPKKNTN